MLKLAATATLLLCFLFLGIVFNVEHEYVEVASRERASNFVDLAIPVSKQAKMSAAGWPWCYSETVSIDSSPPIQVRDSLRLIGNLGVWTLGLVLLIWILRPKVPKRTTSTEEYTSDESGPRSRWRFSLRGALLASAMIGCVFVYYGWLQKRSGEYRQLRKQIESAGGTVTESFWLPKRCTALPEILLGQISPLLYRPTIVSIDNPSPQLIQQLVKIPRLQSLRLSGNSFQLEDIRPIAGNPFFHDLRLSGRSLDPGWLSWIGQCRSLRSLNLMRTNLLGAGLVALDSIPHLKYLNVVHTEVQLKADESNAWAKHLVELWLPGPPQGMSYKHELNGLVNLRHLHCLEYDEFQNREVSLLKVHNCPNLETIELDTLQFYDLDLEKLDRLSQVKNTDYQLENRTQLGNRIASFSWVHNVRLRSLPSLKRLGLAIQDLDKMDIENCPELFLETNWIGKTIAHQSGLSTSSPMDPMLRVDENPVDSEPETSILQAIARSRGIPSISLLGMNLHKLKSIPPLEKCESIVEWDLTCHGLSYEFLEQIAKNPNVKRLAINSRVELFGQNIRHLDFNKLITLFPNLEQLDTNFFAYLERPVILKNNPKLMTYGGMMYYRANSIEIENMPQLSDGLYIDNTLSKIDVIDAPRLAAIVTAKPWPADAKLRGLEDLEAFAAGGVNFRDEHFHEVLRCKSLTWLTLAYTSLSPDLLAKIGELEWLQGVSFAGANFDETAFEGIRKLSRLEFVVLKDTKIPPAVWQWLQSQSQLRQIWIDENCWATLPKGTLENWKNLEEIRLMNMSLDKERIQEMLAAPNLKIFGFQNVTFDEEAMASLINRINASTNRSTLEWDDCQFATTPWKHLANLIHFHNVSIMKDREFVPLSGAYSRRSDSIRRINSPFVEHFAQIAKLFNSSETRSMLRLGRNGLRFINGEDFYRLHKPRLIKPDCFTPSEEELEMEGDDVFLSN